MKEELQEILNTLYEAEALIEMALTRGGAKGEAIARLGADKCFAAADLAAALPAPAHPEEAVEPAEQTEQSEEAEEPEAEMEEVQIFEKEVLPHAAGILATPEPEPDPQPAPETDASIFAPDEEAPEPAVSLTADEDALAALEENDDPGQLPQTPLPAIDPLDADDEPEEEEVEEEEEAESEPVAPHPARRPIKSFFTLNDDFRFRRELFSNSGPDYKAALDLLETMDGADEAREYFFDEMQWDPESDHVKAFIEIITRYFNTPA